MARLRKAPAPQAQTQPAAATTRRALREKTNTVARSTAPTYKGDGNTEGMVTDAKPTRGRPRKVARQDSEDLLMAGAIGPSDEPAPPSDVPTTTDELAKSDAAPIATAKSNRRPPRTVRKVAQNEAQTKVLEGLKQRMEATARDQRAKATSAKAPEPSDTIVVSSSQSLPTTKKAASHRSRELAVERSEFSLSPSPPPPGKLSTIHGIRSSIVQPGSVLKVQSTPAVETSILALKNFKRRPRQPSMLAMVQQRTASARPSAVNTDLAVEDSSIFDLELEDEDVFAPEAEGTPMNAARNKRKSSASVPSGPKRRKSTVESTLDDTRDDTFLTADGEIVVATRSSSARAETPQPAATSDVLIAHAPSSSTPPTEPSSNRNLRGSQSNDVMVPSTEREQSVREQSRVVIPSTEREGTLEPENYDMNNIDEDALDVPNGTMAEPASSSPVPRQPLSAQHNTDTADPVTQVSPARTRPKAKKQKPVSTAVLQALLPKRRKVLKPRQRKTEYDMESDSAPEEDIVLDVSHLENDEDELGGDIRRRVPSKARGRNTTKKARTAKVTASAARKSAAVHSRKASVPPISKSGVRTFGRGAHSDKENDEEFASFDEADESILPDVPISMHDAANGKELEEAKRKFAEVDDWDMDFESISQDDNGNSSQGWR